MRSGSRPGTTRHSASPCQIKCNLGSPPRKNAQARVGMPGVMRHGRLQTLGAGVWLQHRCTVRPMAVVMVEACRCDVCGHTWIASTEQRPTRCGKCRTMRWNAGGRKAQTRPVRARRRSDSAHRATPGAHQLDADPASAIRCPYCGAPLVNNFALRFHNCRS